MIEKDLPTQSKLFRVMCSPEVSEVTEQAINRLCECLHNAKESGAPVLFHVSGGSAFVLLDAIPEDLFGSYLSVTVADERYSSEPNENNSLLLQEKAPKFYSNLIAQKVKYFPLIPEGDEAYVQFALRFDQILMDWQRDNKDGRHIYTIGIGPDGHTLGIHPTSNEPDFRHDFVETTQNVVGYEGNLTPPIRVTPTIAYLRKYPLQAVIYVTGDKKAAVDVMMGEDKLPECPAQIWKALPNAEVYLMTTIEHELWKM